MRTHSSPRVSGHGQRNRWCAIHTGGVYKHVFPVVINLTETDKGGGTAALGRRHTGTSSPSPTANVGCAFTQVVSEALDERAARADLRVAASRAIPSPLPALRRKSSIEPPLRRDVFLRPNV